MIDRLNHYFGLLLIATTGCILTTFSLARVARAQSETVPVENFLTELIQAMTAQSGYSGWAIVIAIFGVLVMFVVRAIKIFANSWWSSLKPIYKIALPFICTSLGTLTIGLAGALNGGIVVKTIIGKLIISAVSAGFAAILGHHVTKKAGATFDEMMVKRDPNYDPGTFRKISSLVADIPQADKAREKLGLLK